MASVLVRFHSKTSEVRCNFYFHFVVGFVGIAGGALILVSGGAGSSEEDAQWLAAGALASAVVGYLALNLLSPIVAYLVFRIRQMHDARDSLSPTLNQSRLSTR